jgi:magnesium transporter
MGLTTVVYRDGVRQQETPPFERISDLLKDESLVIWVDVLDPTPEEITDLQDEFALPEHAVEDAIEAHQRPKLDRYPDHVFGVAYGASLEDDRVVFFEVGMFIAERYLITVRRDRSHPAAQQLVERFEAQPERVKVGGGFLAYVVLDEIVDEYFQTVTDLQDQLAVVESRLLGDQQDDAVLSGVYSLRRNLIEFRRVVAPLRDVLAGVQRAEARAVPTQGLDDYFRDLYDHVVRVYEELDIAREVLSAAQEGYMTAVSNRLNKVVLRVSSWAAIIAVPTFIASVYGMNFRYIPELTFHYGYFICLAAMIAIAALLFWLFKKAGWL